MADSETLSDAVTEALSRETYGSMAQCAGAKGLSVNLLKAVKAMGCNGFTAQGRIHWDIVGPFIEEHKTELEAVDEHDYRHWLKLKTQKEYELKQIQVERERGNTIARTEVTKQLQAISAATMATLRRILEVELPPKLTGLSEHQIRAVFVETVDSIGKKMGEGLNAV
jgi:hypothetical protein